MSIVAPVSSCYPVLTVALALLSGERIHTLRGIGLAATLIGVILAATSFSADANHSSSPDGASSQAQLSEGVGWAICATVGFGVLFWFLQFHVVPVVGAAVSVRVIRVSPFLTLALVAAPARQSFRLPRGGVWCLILGVGLAATPAYLANNARTRDMLLS
jgi:drug/metabolite transporter (DMT)-like permease